jgi:hypothetical protein
MNPVQFKRHATRQISVQRWHLPDSLSELRLKTGYIYVYYVHLFRIRNPYIVVVGGLKANSFLHPVDYMARSHGPRRKALPQAVYE